MNQYFGFKKTADITFLVLFYSCFSNSWFQSGKQIETENATELPLLVELSYQKEKKRKSWKYLLISQGDLSLQLLPPSFTNSRLRQIKLHTRPALKM